MKTKEEILKNHAEQKYIFGDGMTHKQSLILLNSIYMAMDEYASQFQQEWIPVEVRLPDVGKDKDFPNCSEMLNLSNGESVYSGMYEDGSFIDKDGNDFLDEGIKTTHWRPLPPKPQPYNPKQS